MANIKGVDVLIEMNTGTVEAPVWTKIGGQRGGTINRDKDTIESTSKDSAGFKEFEAGLKEWTIETDGLVVVDDEAFSALEDSFMNDTKLKVHAKMPSGTKYEGMALVTSLPTEIPFDDLVSWSATFQGTGKLEKVEV